ncbi:MAG: LPS export ABC transporter permease LptF [Sphingomonadales bacterium]
MLKRIDKYLLKQVLIPFSLTLGVAGLLLVLERMLRLFEFVVNQGGPVDVVFKMLGTVIPHYLGLAFPIGLFLGVLLAFRKISLNSELDAIQASGLGLSRLLLPILWLSIILMALNFLLTGFIQPYSHYTYRQLEFDLRSGALGASVKVGEFVNIGDGIILRIDESRDNGSELYGVFLEQSGTDENNITVTAESGSFFSTNDQQNVVLRLVNGRLVDLNERQQKPRVLSFESQDITINLPTLGTFRKRGDEYLELTIDELIVEMENPQNPIDQKNRFKANFHWRIMSSLTFLILPLFAIPLGLSNKRKPQSLGLFLGMTSIIVYNETMEAFAVQVGAGSISPYTSIWALFAVFFLISLRLFYNKAQKVDKGSNQKLETLWAFISFPVTTLTIKFKKKFSS